MPPLPAGFRVAGTTCGIKESGQPDMTLLAAQTLCTAAGVFTTNRCVAAPIVVNRRHLRNGKACAIVVNSGNANASTGKPGENDSKRMCALVAQRLGCRAGDVLVASTGIIGVPLPMKRIGRGIATLTSKLGRSRQCVEAAARGIMTTDLAMKVATQTVRVGGRTVRLTGLCKGSGMIAPNMATMLAFVLTDAKLPPQALRKAVRNAAAQSFNRISVDQHTSPSDALLVLASGEAGTVPRGKFEQALVDLCRDLAEQIVRDGEGATKLMRVAVSGARSETEADAVAKAVVDSPLVKTAVHGGDPNWGRITTAAGYSGAPVDPDKMTLHLAPPGRAKGICVFRRGVPVKLDRPTLGRLHRVMQGDEVRLLLDLGRGRAAVEWLGCDLSRQYIAINADYTT